MVNHSVRACLTLRVASTPAGNGERVDALSIAAHSGAELWDRVK